MEVQGYSDYLIYEDGRVWSKKRWRVNGGFLKQTISSSGYYRVALCNKTTPKTHTVHRLVAQAYIPNPLNKPQTDHIDGNKLNNDVSNLRWVTNLENGNMFKSTFNPKSGHRGVGKHKTSPGWEYERTYNGIKYRVYCKSKIDALCYKYIILLKIKVIQNKKN